MSVVSNSSPLISLGSEDVLNETLGREEIETIIYASRKRADLVLMDDLSASFLLETIEKRQICKREHFYSTFLTYD